MSSKRKRGAEETKPRQLIMCTTVLSHSGRCPIFYKFESYSINQFITESETSEELEPNACFTWEEKVMEGAYEELLKCKNRKTWCHNMRVGQHERRNRTPTPPYCDMRFLNVGDLVYAVGGHKLCREVFPLSNTLELPTDFSYFSLQKALDDHKVEAKELCKMGGKKYVSVIVEIGGLIYVLSKPGYFYAEEPVFEAYDPSTKIWAALPDPPFFEHIGDRSEILTYMVIGARLYVSCDFFYSSVYDTKLKEWQVCELFSDFPDGLEGVPGCGPPFPCNQHPILYKEKFILATILDQNNFLLAFHISDKEKAERVPFEFFPPIEFGFTQHGLVDLGDDYFIAMLYEQDLDDDMYPPDISDDYDDFTAVTFKLQEENRADGIILRANIVSKKKIKLTVGMPWRGGVLLDYVCAFVYKPSSRV